MPGGWSDYECGTCDKEFPAGRKARDNHCRSTLHRVPDFECDTCSRWFDSRAACDQHMRATHHFDLCDKPATSHAGFQCDFCHSTFPGKAKPELYEFGNLYTCRECDTRFMNRNNIDSHLKSRQHLGRPVVCPFCAARHTTATGLAHHVERGSCWLAPKLNRDTLHEIMQSQDPGGVFTKKLRAWNAPASKMYELIEDSWNGRCYECYECSRDFNSLQSLKQHLRSLGHQRSLQPLYHCWGPSCQRDFKTLGALLNHLESETCGTMRFKTIQRGATDLIRTGRLLV